MHYENLIDCNKITLEIFHLIFYPIYTCNYKILMFPKLKGGVLTFPPPTFPKPINYKFATSNTCT